MPSKFNNVATNGKISFFWGGEAKYVCTGGFPGGASGKELTCQCR